MLGLIILAVAALPLLWREHRLANKYRELIRLHLALKSGAAPTPSTGPAWAITYKQGKATKTVTISAPTEQLALLEACKTLQIRYDKVLSSTPV